MRNKGSQPARPEETHSHLAGELLARGTHTAPQQSSEGGPGTVCVHDDVLLQPHCLHTLSAADLFRVAMEAFTVRF